MKVLRAEVHGRDPLTLGIVLRGSRLARALVGDHTVTAYAYLDPPWKWVVTGLEVPRAIVRQFDGCPFTDPPELPAPPVSPIQHGEIAHETVAVEPVLWGPYVIGTLLTVGGTYVALVAGAGELIAATASWAAGALGYDLGKVLHRRFHR